MDGKIFNRKAYLELLDWKSKLAGKYAVLVEGARRVEKTFLLQYFAFKEYVSHIYIDFSLKGGEIAAAKDAFYRSVNVAELINRLQLIFSDIGKYARGYASKVRAIFRTIPSALSKHEKKFHLSAIDGNARMRRYENAFLWLADAMVANIAYNATSPEVGLDMNLESTSFKCYSLDTGLLLTQAMGVGRETDPRLLRGVLYDNLGIYEGMFFENVVAQSLVASGRTLFFYSRKDQKSAENTMEIDFLVRNGIKICPIEVKSGNYRSHTSLNRFIGKYAKRLGPRYVICTRDMCEDGGIVYLPIYMSHLL